MVAHLHTACVTQFLHSFCSLKCQVIPALGAQLCVLSWTVPLMWHSCQLKCSLSLRTSLNVASLLTPPSHSVFHHPLVFFRDVWKSLVRVVTHGTDSECIKMYLADGFLSPPPPPHLRAMKAGTLCVFTLLPVAYAVECSKDIVDAQ